jgi:hypothetical protein
MSPVKSASRLGHVLEGHGGPFAVGPEDLGEQTEASKRIEVDRADPEDSGGLGGDSRENGLCGSAFWTTGVATTR